MKQWEVLKTVFPDVITDNFEFVDYKETDTTLEYWVDECEYMSREDYKKGHVRPYGFTDSKTMQELESFNAKVKAFRSQFRGVGDIPFFLYRLSMLCA